jgi:hypothetical protein
MAQDVDDESFPYGIVDPLVREQVAHVEEIARMLAIERRDELAREKVGKADDLDFSKAELVFDGRRNGSSLRIIYTARRTGVTSILIRRPSSSTKSW